MKNILKTIFICLAVALVGCAGDELAFVIRYDTINGLKSSDDIVHNGKRIGQVKDIEQLASNAFDVRVVIDQTVMPVVTASADFVIDEHPTEPGRHVINLMSQDLNDPQVVTGQVLEGASALVGLANVFGRSVTEEWQNVFQKVEGMIDGINGETIKDEISPLEAEIDRLMDEANRLGSKARRKLKEEVLPGIQQKIEQLKSEVEAIGEDRSIERIEEKLDRIERTIEA